MTARTSRRAARKILAQEFEPLWRPAGSATFIAGEPRPRARDELERADRAAAQAAEAGCDG